MDVSKIYQVSTLQALMMGYSRAVVTVSEMLGHGNTGLGTFEDVNGEMIVIGGHCYCAAEDGSVIEADGSTGVPFASVAYLDDTDRLPLGAAEDISALKQTLTVRIDNEFGLNSMHIVRIDGSFERICARSESGSRSHHVPLKETLSALQRDFMFENVTGSLICVYYPDFMDGINAHGWHMHFISDDRTRGGHVFDLSMKEGHAVSGRMTSIEIQLPSEPAFDTYSLKEASNDDIKQVETGN